MKNVTNFSKIHLKRRLCLQDDEHTESLKIESREYFSKLELLKKIALGK